MKIVKNNDRLHKFITFFNQNRKTIIIGSLSSILGFLLVFVCLSTVTYSKFYHDSSYEFGTVKLSSFSVNLSNPNSQNPPLLQAPRSRSSLQTVHVGDEPGVYEIAIEAVGDVGGSFSLIIKPLYDDLVDNDSRIVTKTLSLEPDDYLSFNIKTNVPVDVIVDNVIWDHDEVYDNFVDDYAFGLYSISFSPNPNRLPLDFKELDYIESDGSQYIDDIIVNDNRYVIFNKVGSSYESLRIDDDLIYFDNNGNEIIHLVPCEDFDGKVGLYDIINANFYHNKSNNPFIKGDYVYIAGMYDENLYGYMDDVSLSYGNHYPNERLVYPSYNIDGYYIRSWLYNDLIIPSNTTYDYIDDYIKPYNDDTISFSALWDINQIIIFDDESTYHRFIYGDNLTSLTDIPTSGTKLFVGYANSDGTIIIDGNDVSNITAWDNLMERCGSLALYPKFIEVE